MILGKMNTRNKQRTGTSVFGGSFGCNTGNGAGTFSGIGSPTTYTEISQSASLFGGGSKQLAGQSPLFGGNGVSQHTPSMMTNGTDSVSKQNASLFGASGGHNSSMQTASNVSSLFGAGTNSFGTKTATSPLIGGQPGVTVTSPLSAMIGGQPGVTVTSPPSAMFGTPNSGQIPQEPPKSPSLFGTPSPSPPPPPSTQPTDTASLFGQPPPQSTPFAAPPSFGSSAAANSENVTALMESINTLSKKLEASERVVIKYQVVCGIHCHPLTEMSKDELGGPYVNGFTCSRCHQVQSDFSDRYYHCTVCPTDPQKGGVDFCCHCIRSRLGSEMSH